MDRVQEKHPSLGDGTETFKFDASAPRQVPEKPQVPGINAIPKKGSSITPSVNADGTETFRFNADPKKPPGQTLIPVSPKNKKGS